HYLRIQDSRFKIQDLINFELGILNFKFPFFEFGIFELKSIRDSRFETCAEPVEAFKIQSILNFELGIFESLIF
ncbi:MAG: hypothetical protein Q7J34_00405, partial [Bacteroidales bacterium]|nr:hypothetical protein [Bacteroidales bacterium]